MESVHRNRSLHQVFRSELTIMESENSLKGDGRKPGLLSIRLWLPGIEYLWNSGTMHPPSFGCRIRGGTGAKRLGVPVGNWLTAEQGRRL